MNNNLILNISRHVSFNEDETSLIISLFKSRHLKRRELLLEAGNSCDSFYYVVSGALRAFYRDEKSKEATMMFALPDWWITDMPSFISREPAMVDIEAIDDTEVMCISYDHYMMLLERVPKFEKVMRILMQNAYIREQLRALQILSMPAEQRYERFVEKYPGIAQRVTSKNIASYLGITPEFLSLIRNRLRKSGIS